MCDECYLQATEHFQKLSHHLIVDHNLSKPDVVRALIHSSVYVVISMTDLTDKREVASAREFLEATSQGVGEGFDKVFEEVLAEALKNSHPIGSA